MKKKDFSIDIKGIDINGQIFIPENKGPFPTICICHGIPAGNPPDPNDGGYPLLAEKICITGVAVAIFNFRGTGISGGNIDLMGWTRDLSAVIDHLCGQAEIDSSQLILLGFSGGAAVSVCVAANDTRVSGVAACACPADFLLLTESAEASSYVDHFRAIGAIRDEAFPSSAIEWLDGFRKISPIDYIAQIAPRPVLLIHSKDDETVPFEHAHRLYEKAGQPKKLAELDDAGHRLRHDERVLSIFLQWLETLL